MTFRDYRPEDFAALCEIDRICFPPGIAYPPQDLAYWLRQPDAFVFVAEDVPGGGVAGFTLARGERGRAGHIVTIDVRPEYRRRGVATGLLQRAHERLEQAGVTIVRLETAVDNAAAIAFYQEMGYRPTRRLPGYYLNRMDAWLMEKPLIPTEPRA